MLTPAMEIEAGVRVTLAVLLGLLTVWAELAVGLFD